MSKSKKPEENSSSIIATCTGDKKKIWLYGQVALVCLLVIGVWTLASIPVIIFFHLPESEGPSNSNGSANASGGNSVCSAPVQYATTSGICLTEFANILLSSNCLPDPGGSIAVMRNEESTATQLINGFASLGASAECLNKVVPFLCLHVFGLCGGSGVSIQPSSSQCEEVRGTTCQQQWIIIGRLDIGLPDCEMFPAESLSCPAENNALSANGTVPSNMSEFVEDHSNDSTEVLECTGNFYQENGSSYCTRSCSSWVQFGNESRKIEDVLSALLRSISILAAVAIIVISCLSRKRMLVFPAIFIVYLFIGQLVLDLFIIVGFVDRGQVYCPSRSLTKSLTEVTSFCVIFGIVFTYTAFQNILWWFFHTTTLFWKVMFPFHALSFQKSGKNKYIHIACIIVGIVLPLVPIITIVTDKALDLGKKNETSTFELMKSLFKSEGLGFGPNGFPASICSSINSEVTFYSFTLMADFILGCGITMLIIIIWTIHKSYIKRKQVQKNVNVTVNNKLGPQFTFGTAEKKLLIVFFYQIVVITLVLSLFTWDMGTNFLDKDNLQKFLICELGINNPNNTCSYSNSNNSLGYKLLQVLSIIFQNLLPVVNLVYVVNIQELKQLWRSGRRSTKK